MTLPRIRFASIAIVCAVLLASVGNAWAQCPAPASAANASVASGAVTAATFLQSNDGLAFQANRAAQPAAPERRHELGVGVRLGGFNFGLAGSARYWKNATWGVEVDVWRHCVELVEDDSFGVWQFAPIFLYTLRQPDPAKDRQLRPYVGVGFSLMKAPADRIFGDESGTSGGVVVLAGAEVIFKQMPSVGVSGDIGFFQTGTFGGVDVGGFGVSVSGHYYFR